MQIIICLTCLFSLIAANEKNCYNMPGNRFFYFAYGSNLLSARLRINCKSAIFCSPAKLENYRLNFNIIMKDLWNGAVATIDEDPDSSMWGTLWNLDYEDKHQLDGQEVIYYDTNVTVTTLDGRQITAVTYIERKNLTNTAPLKQTYIPENRQPSMTYLKVIIYGAIESGLPPHYIAFLQTFIDNGKLAPVHQRNELGFPLCD